MLLERYSNLIAEVDDIYNSNFNIFKILRVENYEIRHSSFLKWLFNRKGSHNLGYNFFKKIWESSQMDTAFPFLEDEDISIKLESREGNNQIDIIIVGQYATCLIENKFGSKEHSGQCQRYKEGVENKYKDKAKYFIYLDLKKPEDFNEDNYNGYKFISYENIKNILSSLINNKEKSVEVLIIEQYIEILSEKYKPLSKEITEKMAEINLEDLSNIVKKDFKEKELSESEKNFIEIACKYQKEIKDKNDKYIRKIVEDMVKDKNLIFDGYGKGRKSNKNIVKYAVAIEVLPESKKRILHTIDYSGETGLSIGIYAGLKAEYSRNLIDYIENNVNFFSKIKELSKNEWEIKTIFKLKDGSGFNDLIEVECNLKEIIKDKKFPIKDFIGMHNDSNFNKLKEYISYHKSKGYFDCDNAEKLLESIENYINKKNNKHKYNTIHSLYGILAIYKLNQKEIDDNNMNDIKKIYKEKTLEGLSLYGIEEEFKNKTFKND